MKKLIFLVIIFSCIQLFSQESDTTANTAAQDSTRLILDKYIDALGGKEKLSSVNDRTTSMTGEVQGFDVKMIIYQKIPAFFREEIQASGLDQVIIFNGDEGIMKIGDDVQHIIGDELLRLKFEATMGLILNPDSSGIKMQLVDKINLGDSAITFNIKSTSGNFTWNTYYNVETGLKMLEEKEVKTPAGRFLQKIWYDDYREVSGVKYPFVIKQQLGNQQLSFKVHSIKINQDVDDKLFLLE